MARKSGLGKGLDALFKDNTSENQDSIQIKLSEIEPNRDQPRTVFDEEALTSLADSIREHGIIQPLLVRPMSNGRYQIVAGERRWRASRMIGLKEVPVIIKELSDKETMEIALIENLQREDLNAMEEARGYQELMDAYDMTQEEVSQRVGKSRSAVANSLRLLSLPKSLVYDVESGNLSAGQGRAILAFEDEEKMLEAAKVAVKKGMSVRELERLAAKEKRKETKKDKQPNVFKEDNFYNELEISMKEELHRKVKIEQISGQHGKLTIDFYNKEELLDIAYRIANLKRN